MRKNFPIFSKNGLRFHYFCAILEAEIEIERGKIREIWDAYDKDGNAIPKTAGGTDYDREFTGTGTTITLDPISAIRINL